MARASRLRELFDSVPAELSGPALSHSSWVELRTDGFGRFAFLGDRVLGLAISDELYGRFPDDDIGALTKILIQVVSGRACAQVAREMGLVEDLADRAPGPESGGLPVETLEASERTLASFCEAVIGACYLHHGYETTAGAVLADFAEQIELALSEPIDFKSRLQERLARSGAHVTYEVVAEEGPPHDRRFDVTALIRGKPMGSGSGRSKKEAEQAAAAEALEAIGSPDSTDPVRSGGEPS